MSDIEYRLFDPKVDYVFKILFGDEDDKSMLISLLNAILKGKPTIKDLILNNTDIPKILKDNKSCKLDILATSDEGIKFNIEMQCKKTKDIINRTVQYASKLFTKDLKENVNKADSAFENEFYRNHSVISIWIFGENVTDRESAINEGYVTLKKNDKDDYEILTDNLRIIYLELNKYKITKDNIDDKLTKWVDFLTNPINLEKSTFEDEDIEKARKKLEFISSDDKERASLEAIKEGLFDQYSSFNIGKKEGLKEGLDKGLKEGEKKGKIEIARNMLKDNVDINIISKYSGLNVEEINKIK